LANAADNGIVDLPLGRDLYPSSSLRAAAEAFHPYCCVRECPPVGNAPAMLSITILPEYRSEGRQVLGDFLNFLLNHSVAGHLRIEGEER